MPDVSPDALIYITYAHVDVARVEPVVASLRDRGFEVYFDSAVMQGSGNYVHESQRALRRARALVVFVSQAAIRSSWVEAETRAFQSLTPRDQHRTLISVCLDATPLPVSLKPYATLQGASAAPETLAAEISRRLDGQPAAPDEEQARGMGIADVPASAADSTPPTFGVASPFDTPPTDIEPDGRFEAEATAPSPQMAPPPPAPYTPPPSPAAPPLPAPPSSEVFSPGFIGPTTGQHRVVGARDGSPRAAQPHGLEQVTFTAYYPRELQPQQWQPLVVYLSLDDAATMALVASAAADRLAGKLKQFRAGRSEKAAGLTRGASLRVVPIAPGIQFNPAHLDVTWQEDVQQHEFRMRATTAQPGRAVNGSVQFYQGMVLRAEVPISVFVGQAAARLDSPDAYAHAIARAYRRIFASYSHQDMPIVESCETAARTMGDQYLRDVTLLQSGMQWDPRLIQAINDADIFQLFWSKRAATSPFVEREWRHALMLLPTRPNFIRPVYWDRQLYPIPSELKELHFQPLSLPDLGWGWLRTLLYELRNR